MRAAKGIGYSFVAALLAAATASSLLAQQPAAPAFEAATIKPSTRDSPPMSLQRRGSRIVTSNTPLAWLVSWAFDLDDGRLIGAPNGAESARFDVDAKLPDGDAAPGQSQRMMRSLLTDRFHLAVHREIRQLPGYVLVVENNGPKVRPRSTTERPGPNPFRMTSAGTLIGTQVNADMLAKTLSSELRRPVHNSTGLSGVFDFTLEWRPDSAAITDSTRPSIFTALREQLGLRLDAGDLPAEVVIVDHLDLVPTPN